MRIRLLGATAVWDDNDAVVPLGGAKQRAVLAQLCREPNRAVGIDRLAEGLWGEHVPDRYRQNIQVYVSTWRRVLDAGRPAGAPTRIVGHRDAYELLCAPGDIDVVRFADLGREGTDALVDGRPDEAARLLRGALELWWGEPLADLADHPFAGDWVSELEASRVEMLDRRIEADLARGALAGLSVELESLVVRHPERERLWHHLVVALYREGRQTDALEVVRRARARLAEEFGVDPGEGLRRVERQVLDHDPGLIALAPVSVSRPLPKPIGELFGRDATVKDLVARLESGSRLLTLVGPGGVGKTRLVLALGHELAARGRRIVWVPLADVAEVEVAQDEIRTVVGGEPAEALRGSATVLMLDNLEQLGGLAPTLQSALEGAGDLQVVVTSRSPLGVPGEERIDVEPLGDEDDLVGLFVQRARAVDPTVSPEEHREDILAVCRLLDGLPLAIELAAARSRTYSPGQLMAALVAGQDVTLGEGRPGRHASVTNAVGWSIGLLTPADRVLFARLSVCDSVDRATALVLSEDPGSLDRLVQVALVRPLETRAGRRFGMLTTVRAVSRALFETSGDSGVTMDRLSQVVLGWAATADPAGAQVARDLAQVEADLPMTRLVIDHLLAKGDLEGVATVILAVRRPLTFLGRIWLLEELTRGLLGAGYRGLQAARVDVVLGSVAYGTRASDLDTDALLARVQDIAEDDDVYRSIGHNYQCARGADLGQVDAARIAAERGLEAARRSGRPVLVAASLSVASWAALRRGDAVAAVVFAREALDHVESDANLAMAWNDLALAQLWADEIDGARATLEGAVRLGYRVGPPWLDNSWKLSGSVFLRNDDGRGAAGALAAGAEHYTVASDPALMLEFCAQVGLVEVMTGARETGVRRVRRANGYAEAVLGEPNAVPEYDEVVAARHGIPAGEYGAPLSSERPMIDFVLDCREAAQRLARGAPREE
ncbi:MAG: BTAD domain-containing putative transcriptional regulator [Lapillicoccus sp.]